jgi:hypothetical protein
MQIWELLADSPPGHWKLAVRLVTASFQWGTIYTPTNPNEKLSCLASSTFQALRSSPKWNPSFSTPNLWSRVVFEQDPSKIRVFPMRFTSLGHLLALSIAFRIYYSWSLAPRWLEVLKNNQLVVWLSWEVCITLVALKELKFDLCGCLREERVERNPVLCGLLNGDVESLSGFEPRVKILCPLCLITLLHYLCICYTYHRLAFLPDLLVC